MKIGIFDDHTMMHHGLTDLIKKQMPSCQVMFNCNNQNALFENIKKHHPDILILDIVVPDVTGLELFEKISKDFPEIKMIAHTALTSPVLVDNLLSLKVRGYVNKRQPESEIVEAVKQVTEEKIYLPQDYKYLMKKSGVKENTFLSEREKEIIGLIAKERTSSEIAEQLSISENTVENHRKNIFQKLKVKNSAGMVMEATRLGYLS
jgi:DNA-binding NarL/FixJ family response regulator